MVLWRMVWTIAVSILEDAVYSAKGWDGDDPLARGDPGDHLLDQVSGHRRPMPVSTRRTKAALLATEGEEHLVLIGVTGGIVEDGVQVCALNFPETHVQHQPKSRCAVLRFAAGRSGGLPRRAGGAASAGSMAWPPGGGLGRARPVPAQNAGYSSYPLSSNEASPQQAAGYHKEGHCL